MRRRSRSALHGLVVVALWLVLAFGFPFAITAAPGGNGPKSIDPALVKKLKDGARGSVTISINEATAFASFIESGRNGDLLPNAGAQPKGKAKGFLKQYGGILGVADADSDLVETATSTDKYGATHITYEQRYKGLPVYGGVVKVHVDAGGDLTAVNGTIVPAIDMKHRPETERRPGDVAGQSLLSSPIRPAAVTTARPSSRLAISAQNRRSSRSTGRASSRVSPAPTSSHTRSW